MEQFPTLTEIIQALKSDSLFNEKVLSSVTRLNDSSGTAFDDVVERIISLGRKAVKLEGAPLSKATFMKWLKKRFNIVYVFPEDVKKNNSIAINYMSYEFASTNLVVPYDENDTQLFILTSHNQSINEIRNSLNTLEQYITKTLIVHFTTHNHLVGLIREFYSISDQPKPGKVLKPRRTVEISTGGKDNLYDAPEFFKWLLKTSINARASDIHFEHHQDIVQIRLRIDGTLHTLKRMEPSVHTKNFVRYIKTKAEIDTTEDRTPQDGRLSIQSPESGENDLRISILPNAGGPKMVIRILSSREKELSFDSLGFDEHDSEMWGPHC